jgi:mersacidin/lichenicidin family type 2 lantibiotic
MGIGKIIRTWRDPEYRDRLSEGERAALPENPVGAIQLTDAELGHVVGSAQSGSTIGCHTKTCVTSQAHTQEHPCSHCG